MSMSSVSAQRNYASYIPAYLASLSRVIFTTTCVIRGICAFRPACCCRIELVQSARCARADGFWCAAPWWNVFLLHDVCIYIYTHICTRSTDRKLRKPETDDVSIRAATCYALIASISTSTSTSGRDRFFPSAEPKKTERHEPRAREPRALCVTLARHCRVKSGVIKVADAYEPPNALIFTKGAATSITIRRWYAGIS